MKHFTNLSPLGAFSAYAHKLSLGDHLCKFYQDDNSLIETFCNYIIPGITRGDGIILIATAAHKQVFEDALTNRSIDCPMAKANGQLVILDAEETLEKFMVDGMPDELLFQNSVGKLLENHQLKFPFIRAYGEMVDVLWKKKNHPAAIELEKLWNEAAKIHPFTLLCAYNEQSFHEHGSGLKLQQICTSHTHIIFTDGELQS